MKDNMIITATRRKNRTRKYDLFVKEINPLESDLILDVGFCNQEYSAAVDNYLEKHYPYPQKITALGVADEGDNVFKQCYPAVKTVLYDGRIFPFTENMFNIGWSNAVLEHVGEEEQQVVFLKEMHRTCKKLFFTTPNRYFPFELHTRIFLLHWLPKTVFDKILSLTSKSWAAGDYMHLLSHKKLEKILKKAGITNFKIYKNRFLGFTMDFCIVVM
ncbi:methyltransferase domain-containing protein [Candidatus Symbiothrix dinenymphae]|uniref:methyltransferase domain-containing protein n=1 Tax=Candidatus Symbiothrix dinenymphae TaxID=467085 RepID=UPI0006C1A6BC|nr:methyltransferase domain-containing protein [Candidatus Symbiothrix dinenymphae]GAP72471.1 hypothetical protein SAMD00024442_32_45 [Candidatus Symbiothrix dinenymphae]